MSTLTVTGENSLPLRSALLLNRAAAFVERYGLYQGCLWPGARDILDRPVGEPSLPQGHYVLGDPCCPLGALAVVAGVWLGDDVARAFAEMPVLALAAEALGTVLTDDPRYSGSVWLWNDRPGRDAADPVTALRKAAQHLITELCHRQQPLIAHG